MKSENSYKGFIINNVPRVLSHINKDPDSKQFGCCDRNYWQNRLSDFPNAMLQQSGLVLSLLYNFDFDGNIYYKNYNIYNWARGSLDYWKKIQLSDGSYNEWYPHEHGFPPTAFTLFAAAQSYRILELEDEDLRKAMLQSAKWLAANTSLKAYNQEAASICALYSTYLVTGQKWILANLEEKIPVLLKGQSVEGWFPEQGGADLGYSTVTLDMLAEYYWLSKDTRMLEPLNKLLDFLKYFCHPDRTFGGEYGSRNTIYFLPSGIEVMVCLGNKTAKQIKDLLFLDTGSNSYFQNSLDERYLLHYVTHSFLRALQKEESHKKHNNISKMHTDTEDLLEDSGTQLPCMRNHEKYFSESGLYTYKNDNYFMVISAKKGGTVKVFDSEKEIFVDFGYRALHKNNIISATNWLDESYNIEVKDHSISIKGNFNKIKIQTSSTFKFFLVRLVMPLFYKTIREILYKKLIFINKHSNLFFERVINIKPQSIEIIDIITGNHERLHLHSATNLSLRFTASDKFFSKTDLLSEKRIELSRMAAAKTTQVFDFYTGKTSVMVENKI